MKNLSGTAKGWIETNDSVSTSSVETLPRETKVLDLTETFEKLESFSDHLDKKYKEHKDKKLYDAMILLTMIDKSLKQ